MQLGDCGRLLGRHAFYGKTIPRCCELDPTGPCTRTQGSHLTGRTCIRCGRGSSVCWDGADFVTTEASRLHQCIVFSLSEARLVGVEGSSLDGDLVASGSIDGILKVHSLSQKSCVYETKLPSAPVQDVCFDPSGRFLVRQQRLQRTRILIKQNIVAIMGTAAKAVWSISACTGPYHCTSTHAVFERFAEQDCKTKLKLETGLE